jgi:hypothetical protein
MTTDELLQLVEARGLKVVLKDGQPVLVRTRGNEGVTDSLLKVLKRHRAWIIAKLTPPPAQGGLFGAEKRDVTEEKL